MSISNCFLMRSARGMNVETPAVRPYPHASADGGSKSSFSAAGERRAVEIVGMAVADQLVS